MPTLTAAVVIPTPPRYMTRLAKHFEHRVSVERDERSASIHFPEGLCTLAANEATLDMKIECASPDLLARYQEVVTRHLKQVASAEQFDVNWSSQT